MKSVVFEVNGAHIAIVEYEYYIKINITKNGKKRPSVVCFKTRYTFDSARSYAEALIAFVK